MKNSAGRWILISFVVICLGFGMVLYRILKDSSEYKGLVLAQMHKEFIDYYLVKGKDKIVVATLDSKTFTVDLKKDWNFFLHDKLLVVKAPSLDPLPEPTMKSEVEDIAIKNIENLLKTWLLDKFHTLDKITLQVQF